ncbi:MAG: preprotein translocase subunit SecG [Phycisphaera sp. TMED24]|jgi:preprotein translocase subunit SecG|nr:MAG: preprotein translocase subunit SecG [Phycisphaera sp. TMED24]
MNNLNSFYLLTGLFMVVSTVMILVILMQRPKGGGLSAAFGGSSAGSADSLLGGRVGDTLTWVTVVAFVLYLGLAISLNMSSGPGAADVAGPAEALEASDTSAPIEALPVAPIAPEESNATTSDTDVDPEG